jgi:polyvinyl alcohol dehydrogenase (cytochrome)
MMLRHAFAIVVAALLVSACGNKHEGRTEQGSGTSPTVSTEIGKALAEGTCGACHWPAQGTVSDAGVQGEHGDTVGLMSVRPPSKVELEALSPATVVTSLERGTMRNIGAALDTAQRIAIAEYVTGKKYVAEDTPGFYCPSSAGPDALTATAATWADWGGTVGNTRFQSAEAAKLGPSDVPKLQLKWALALAPGRAGSVVTSRGSMLFFGDQAGKVRAVDRATGCVHWVHDAGRWVRATVSLVPAGSDRFYACYGTSQGPASVACLDAATGAKVWETSVVDHPHAYVSTGAALHDGSLYVPISVGRESHGPAQDPTYECCTGRGALVAIDAATGAIKWRTFTTDEPRPTRKSGVGTQLWGPSGASVWKAPLVDSKLPLVYVTTGQNSSLPATKTSNALLAIDRATGEIQWSFQLTADDIWNAGCNAPEAKGANENCPFVVRGGVDVSTPLMINDEPRNRRLLILADKSGRVVALDPDKNGAVIWDQKPGKGGFFGGINWGMAADADNLYVPLHDRLPFGDGKLQVAVVPSGKRDNTAGALVALRLSDGAEVWRSKTPDVCAKRRGCAKAFSSAPAVIPGVVFAASLDGHVRAFSTNDGSILWDFDTAREVQTVGGGRVSGGSIDGPGGVVVVDGSVVVSSGYGAYGTMPGNAMMVFAVPEK